MAGEPKRWSTDNLVPMTEGECPKCRRDLMGGYGLMGGGVGRYEFCTADDCDWMQKWPEAIDDG